MFKPENTSVENIEKSSVNRFDPGYKNLAVIKKSLVQVAGWSDIRETGPRKMTFGALTAWKICSILTISSVSASAPRGAVSIFFWKHHCITFLNKNLSLVSLEKSAIESTLEIFCPFEL